MWLCKQTRIPVMYWLVVTTFLTVCTHIQIVSNRNQSNNLFTENHIHFFKKPIGHHNTPHFQNLHAHVQRYCISSITLTTKQNNTRDNEAPEVPIIVHRNYDEAWKRNISMSLYLEAGKYKSLCLWGCNDKSLCLWGGNDKGLCLWRAIGVAI